MSVGSGAARPTREVILAAALEAFDRQGYGSTSLSEIRRSTGVSTGSLYHHFASKEHVAAALVARGIGDYQDRFLHMLRDAGDAREGVRGGVVFHLRWARHNRALARFVLAAVDAGVAAAVTPEVVGRSRRFMREVHGWIAGHVEAGRLVALPRDLYYPVWIGPAQELTRQWVAGRTKVSIREAEMRLAESAWRVLGLEPARE